MVSFLRSSLGWLADHLRWCTFGRFQRLQRQSYCEWHAGHEPEHFRVLIALNQLEFFPPKGDGQPIHSQFLQDALPSNLFPHVNQIHTLMVHEPKLTSVNHRCFPSRTILFLWLQTLWP